MTETTLYPPNYKLWDYELELRKREIIARTGVAPQTNVNGVWSLNLPTEIDPVCLKQLVFTHRFKNGGPSESITWQGLLENGENGSGKARKESNYVTHGIHPYKGKFYPQLVKSLINLANLQPGQTLVDVFCGSGTTLLEGYLNGLHVRGCDFNPLAAKIAQVKTEILKVEPSIREGWFEEFLKGLRTVPCQLITNQWLDRYETAAQNEIVSWFPEMVIQKLAIVWAALDSIEKLIVRDYLEIIVSSIVREVSQQDPRDLRIRRRKPQIDDAPVMELLVDRLTIQRQKLRDFDNVRLSISLPLGNAIAWKGDSRNITDFVDQRVDCESVDAVITSPPYATALPYIDTDRLSILLLYGLPTRQRSLVETALTGTRELVSTDRRRYNELIEENDFGVISSTVARNIISEVHNANQQEVVGFRRRDRAILLYKYFEDITRVLSTTNTLLKKGGQAFFVLGNNMTQINGRWAEIDSIAALIDIASQTGLNLVEEIPITVTRENYLHMKNSITHNSILWFRK